MDKKVSVVVPCYKYANYLPECIESLVNQTYPIHEIIIVDDGSPDDTIQVAQSLIEKYKNSNIILVTKENGGLSSARNAGIEIATGDWIMCLDADDKIVPAAIEEHVKLIEDEKTIAQCSLMEFGDRHISYVPQPTSLERIMQSNTVFCNAMFSKNMWEEVGGYDESETMRFGYEDWEFWLRMLKAGCYVRTSDFIALRYRAHSNNMTKETSHPNRQKLYKYIYDKHRDLYEEKNLTVSGLII